MPNCPKCSHPLQPSDKQCPICGTPCLNPLDMAIQIEQRRKRIRVIVGVLVLLVLMVVSALLGRNMFPVTVAEAPAASTGKLLQAPPAPPMPGGVLQAPGKEAPQPDDTVPADVMAYLKQLQVIETYRQQMQGDLSGALGMMVKAMSLKVEIDDEEMAKKSTSLSQDAQAYANQWAVLAQNFEQIQAPPSCSELHGAYRAMLSQSSAYLIQIHFSLEKAMSDPTNALQVLTQIQAGASRDVDNLILQANLQLQTVLDTNKVRKYFPDFEVRTDSGTNMRSVLGSYGL
ncbi:MAG: zinc ribbon domain-containing protein [Armatimonadota bacterium]